MTMPHQCRCAICGEIGVITPGLPNIFAPEPEHILGTKEFSDALNEAINAVDPEPAGQPPLAQPPLAQPPLAQPPLAQPPLAQPPLAPLLVTLATLCTHGYTFGRCIPGKFQPELQPYWMIT